MPYNDQGNPDYQQQLDILLAALDRANNPNPAGPPQTRQEAIDRGLVANSYTPASNDQAILAMLGKAGLAPNFNNLPVDVQKPMLDPQRDPILDSPTDPASSEKAYQEWAAQQIKNPDQYYEKTAQLAEQQANDPNRKPDASFADFLPTQPKTWIDLVNTASNKNAPMADRAAAITEDLGGKITASVDSKGQLVLEGKGTTVTPGTQQDLSLTSNVRNILSQMQQTKDPDQFRALQGQFNEAMANATAQTKQNLLTSAEAKLGIPSLEVQLQQAEQADRADPMWRPGIGDSPITAKIRQTLQMARSAADQEVNRSMLGNVTLNTLSAAEKTAQEQGKRIEATFAKQTNLDMQVAAHSLQKKMDGQDKLQAIADGMTPDQKLAIRAIDPSKAAASDTELAQVYSKNANNKTMLDAINAPPESLPSLAATGNQYAVSVLKDKERSVGMTDTETDTNISKMKEIITSPGAFKQAIKLVMGNTPEAKARLAEVDAKSGGSAEDKKAAFDMKVQIAKQAIAENQTNQYLADANNIGGRTPELDAAIAKAQSEYGKRDLISVAKAYTGDLQGPQLTAKVAELNAIIAKSAKSRQGSQFGMPNYMRIKNAIEGATIGRWTMQKLFDNWQPVMG